MKYKILLNFVLIILLYSCSKIDYEFTQNFSSYLKTNFNHEIKSECLYIVIPAHACEGCTETVINRLKSKNYKSDKIILIPVAETNAELNYIISELNGFIIIKDFKNNYLKEMKYEGIYPYIIEVKNKKVVFHKEIKMSDNIGVSLDLLDNY